MTTTEIDRFNKLICLNRKGLLIVVKRNVTDVLCNQSPQTRQTPLPSDKLRVHERRIENDVSKTTGLQIEFENPVHHKRDIYQYTINQLGNNILQTTVNKSMLIFRYNSMYSLVHKYFHTCDLIEKLNIFTISIQV